MKEAPAARDPTSRRQEIKQCARRSEKAFPSAHNQSELLEVECSRIERATAIKEAPKQINPGGNIKEREYTENEWKKAHPGQR